MSTEKQLELFSTHMLKSQSDSWFANAIERFNIAEIPGWPDIFGNALIQWNRQAETNKVRVLSLFSGAGGLDIGFHDAGFHIVECNEIEPKFSSTLQLNTSLGKRLHGTKVICKDIREYEPSVDNIDFIIGGPPCQTFSAAGARANGVNGTDDDRGNLFLQYARIIDQLKPEGFLFENVYRIVGAQDGKPWQQIQLAFRDLGYILHWRILDAADYGVPQFRERLIIVGLKSGSFRFPLPSHGPDAPDQRQYYTAQQAVTGIDTSTCKIGLAGRHGHLLNDIPPGLNYSFYTERMGHPTPLFGWRSKFSDYLYKADPETPVRTIKAQGGQYTGPFSWENRPFSLDELKRLQTFPDDYPIAGNRQNVIHQLGNSVPPQLARVLALSILHQVFRRPLPFTMEVLADNQSLNFRSRKTQLTEVYTHKALKAIEKLPEKPLGASVSVNAVAYFTLMPNLQLKLSDEKQSTYKCKYALSESVWVIELSDRVNENTANAYSINVRSGQAGALRSGATPCETILVSRSESVESLLALWKIYEYLLRVHTLKDDLVQFFGYYQYKSVFSMSMELHHEHLRSSAFWRVACLITGGLSVGVIHSITAIAEMFNISEKELSTIFISMKQIGFEIRNHRTNRQIPMGSILIPYAFPSLNERSLQRLTSL